MALPSWFLVLVGGRRSQRSGSSPTLGSLGSSHNRRHKSRVSLRGPPCSHGVLGIPYREVLDMVSLGGLLGLFLGGFWFVLYNFVVSKWGILWVLRWRVQVVDDFWFCALGMSRVKYLIASKQICWIHALARCNIMSMDWQCCFCGCTMNVCYEVSECCLPFDLSKGMYQWLIFCIFSLNDGVEVFIFVKHESNEL